MERGKISLVTTVPVVTLFPTLCVAWHMMRSVWEGVSTQSVDTRGKALPLYG
jgi:hypothetical protein